MNDQRDLPEHLDGYGPVRPYGQAKPGPSNAPTAERQRARDKRLADLDAALSACEVGDGATMSFHHHLRNGDGLLNAVMEVAARRGLRDLNVAATSIFPVHAPLVEHIRAGTVSRLSASFMAGPVAEAVSQGDLPNPAVLRTHGGRSRALLARELEVDVAFVAAPTADAMGNLNGADGPRACGPLGYPMSDVEVARRVVAVTDNLVAYPAPRIDIAQDKVDHVVEVDSLGDAQGIVSGTTRPAGDPVSLEIADHAAGVIAASGLLVPGFSLQNGAGGISLATAAAVRRRMSEHGIVGSFASGGITAFHVEMLEAGLFQALLDVQCFDAAAVRSYRRDPRHQAMSASMYANPHLRGAVVDRLDAVVLGAAEIDTDFNVNVTTRSDGIIIGGSGGHADTAAGAKLTIVTTRLSAAGYAKIVERVGTLTTPGDTIDVLVTDSGIAVNPKRPELQDRIRAAGLPVKAISDLQALAAARAEHTATPRGDGRVVAVSEYRDGRVTDLIRQV